MPPVRKKRKPETLTDLSARSVDSMFQALPKDERVMMQRLRILVTECLPKAREQGYYGMGIPFYRHQRLICFLWPPSVFWGPGRTNETQRKKGFALGFCQGYLMAKKDGVLLAEGRKQVYCMYFKSIEEINDDQIRALLFEAGMVDESFAKKSKRKKGISRR